MKFPAALLIALFTLNAHADFVDIDVRRALLEPDQGQLFIPCSFDGHPLNCFFDTGAGRSHVPGDEFFSGYASEKEGKLGGASGHTMPTDEIRILETKVGTAVSQSLVINRIRMTGQSGPIFGVPLIGNDFFGDKTITFDFTQKRLHFENQKPGSTDSNELKIYKGKWIGFPVQLAGQNFETLWDTGASMTVVDEKLVAEHPEKFRFLRDEQGTDGLKTWSTKIYKTDLEFPGQTLTDVTVVAIDFSPIQKGIGADVRGIVGFNVITKFNWLIDYKNARWAVWK